MKVFFVIAFIKFFYLYLCLYIFFLTRIIKQKRCVCYVLVAGKLSEVTSNYISNNFKYVQIYIHINLTNDTSILVLSIYSPFPPVNLQPISTRTRAQNAWNSQELRELRVHARETTEWKAGIRLHKRINSVSSTYGTINKDRTSSPFSQWRVKSQDYDFQFFLKKIKRKNIDRN